MLIKEKVKPLQPFRVDNGNIHGHVCIDLHNTKSGFTERIQGDNLVTNAAQDILNLAAIGHTTPPYNLLPLATNLLGGLFIFDGALQENVNNVSFPGSQAKFVGSAGDRVDTSLNILGVRNNEESEVIQGGYKTVWDFSTNCCNGTIKSLARTSLKNGNDLKDFTIIFQGQKASNPKSTIQAYLYNNKIYWRGDIYQSPFQGEHIYYQNQEYLQLTLQSFNSSFNSSNMMSLSNLDTTLYSTAGSQVYSIDFLTNTRTDFITLPSSIYNNGGYCVKNNYVYSYSSSSKKIYKTNLNNVSDFIEIVDIPIDHSQYKFSPLGNNVLIFSTTMFDHGNQGLIYDDNTFIPIENNQYLVQEQGSQNYQFLQNKPYYLKVGSEYSDRSIISFIIIPFLGTIFNLPEAITKTANQTMKITYTLTNV